MLYICPQLLVFWISFLKSREQKYEFCVRLCLLMDVAFREETDDGEVVLLIVSYVHAAQ